MSYVDEVIDLVVKKNPAEPEFHQAVKEVLESLRVVVEANEEKFRKDALLERLVEPERQIKFRVPWVDDKGQAFDIAEPWMTKSDEQLIASDEPLDFLALSAFQSTDLKKADTFVKTYLKMVGEISQHGAMSVLESII